MSLNSYFCLAFAYFFFPLFTNSFYFVSYLYFFFSRQALDKQHPSVTLMDQIEADKSQSSLLYGEVRCAHTIARLC